MNVNWNHPILKGLVWGICLTILLSNVDVGGYTIFADGPYGGGEIYETGFPFEWIKHNDLYHWVRFPIGLQ